MNPFKILKSQLYSEGPINNPVLRSGHCRCGYVFFPMQTYGCERCGSHGDAVIPQGISTHGTLLASAVVQVHADQNRPVPFTIVKVALDDGPVVRTLLSDDCGDIAPGQRMQAKLAPLHHDDGEPVYDLRFTAVV